MSTLEKALIPLFLIASLTLLILRKVDANLGWLFAVSGLVAVLVLLVLATFYYRQTKTLIYKLSFVLMSLLPIGGLFKLLHLPGADLIIIGGLVGTLIVPILLIRTAYKHPEEKRAEAVYNFVIGFLLILQFLLSTKVLEVGYPRVTGYLNYALLAAILSMKFKGVVLKLGESRLLTLLALQISIVVMMQLVDVFLG